MIENMQKKWESLYYSPREPASFSSVTKLQKASNAKSSLLVKWLEGQDTYTLHKPYRKHFRRNRVIVYAMDEQWQADFADMRSISKHNDNYKYILTCIDILSKYVLAVFLKSKTGQSLVDAFKLIFKDGRKPTKINTDQGTGFENTVFKSFVKHHKIHSFTTRSDMKASVVERFNQTLKTKMWRYFTARNTYRYIDVLKDLLFSYNNSNQIDRDNTIISYKGE